ncbi:hypothetical protein EF847_00160 [Actinobacteria bacterium YIM 96077]|uniref:Uncharacterized protein n=1 Tax=Phytoactinopolyspora halophila TaxID=1981511 RepID=A0A329QR59_9ACTN|nr:hypothetical protein [Phytoactinopolyspora halophila]AYY11367.1 hypothetical protein EF847_00160 [Actinobacteria bacterium YIM 96077]RAW14683.1 hypothetical protein DPM12_10510 [Phytoactinopolyspora halophila]
MSTPEPDEAAQTTEHRIAVLEDELRKQKTFGGYARLYAPLAALSATLSFTPILNDVVVEHGGGTESRRTFGTLWDMAGRSGGDPAALGIMLVGIFTALLVAATWRPTTLGLPVGIVVAGVPILLMLIVRPSTGSPTPDLSPYGVVGVVVIVSACLLAVVQAAHHLSSTHGTGSDTGTELETPTAPDAAPDAATDPRADEA